MVWFGVVTMDFELRFAGLARCLRRLLLLALFYSVPSSRPVIDPQIAENLYDLNDYTEIDLSYNLTGYNDS